jgi:hypothetical protein
VRWKTYLNQLINIVTMSPEAGNRVLVYKMVAMYFEMMIRASSTAQFLHPPTECGISGLTPAQTDSVIESSRKIDFHCPPSFNFEIDLQVAKLKGDCEKFSVEAGKLWLVSLEKNFKKGTSTIAGGVGISQGFGKAGKASLKQWIYITFDNNNNFSDLGLKGTAEVAVNSNPIKITEEIGTITRKIGGIEGGYTLGINSGLQTSVKGKGILANFVNISYPFK